jgi:hypothetical protein
VSIVTRSRDRSLISGKGYGSYDGGWNRGKICFFVYSTTTLTLPLAPKWTIYFCGKFDQPIINAYTFKGNESLLSQHDHSNNSASNAQVVGAVFSFNSTNVTSRVGISWISAAKACDFIDEEIPAGSTLNGLVQASKQAWNQQVLSKIQTTNTVTSNLQQLYSNLYGMLVSISSTRLLYLTLTGISFQPIRLARYVFCPLPVRTNTLLIPERIPNGLPRPVTTLTTMTSSPYGVSLS